ncbi:UDP-galactopyranose mutase [Palleronia marisminoris]|uniref:UDP-galactopyranose mutase n=1 Tax=Palleronia marisminoris TaxID=315423 RepID=A0A1Y5TRZ9_9RHOB|nr:NAD(P)/FAD-dependent oxidoreductase [Palleronia marisminoris]SFH49691.1 UDP-galactopyranose mutase [Palleronia marisminoris]SLN70477.1 UDP-galactopyranose mutase [Palleronia marisminoris]
MNGPDRTALILGGGPAGLTAAYELQKLSRPDQTLRPVVFEADSLVGGISRTEHKDGYRFDIGGHRFFTKVPEVQAMWEEILGDDFLTRPRRSRIYYRGKFYDYPLKIFNALGNIGPYEAMRIMLSYGKWRVFPSKKEDNFEEWVMNRFGGRLYMHFFRSYTEKVWGISPKVIRADWAAQRIKNLSLSKAVWNALSSANDTTSLIEEFQYPRLGPGMMWEKTAERVEDNGGAVHLETRVGKVFREGNRVTGVEVTTNGETRIERGDHVISSLALDTLIGTFDPPPPPHVIEAARKLRYRDFLIVTLVLDHPDPFPDNWIYVHSPDVQVGRIQNFRAWSPEMLSDEATASIGMEYFCAENDALWSMEDDALTRLAAGELEQLGLAKAESVTGSFVIRQPKAYPVYDEHYQEAVDTIADWIKTLENFDTVGRNGLHRYNNQDHSMLSAMKAAENAFGADHDVWHINTERSYHEEFMRPEEEVEEVKKTRAG